jgi:hypothetical protein
MDYDFDSKHLSELFPFLRLYPHKDTALVESPVELEISKIFGLDLRLDIISCLVSERGS